MLCCKNFLQSLKAERDLTACTLDIAMNANFWTTSVAYMYPDSKDISAEGPNSLILSPWNPPAERWHFQSKGSVIATGFQTRAAAH